MRYSIPMVLNYPEAMVTAIKSDDPAFLGAKAYMMLYLAIVCWYGWKLWKARTVSVAAVVPVFLLAIVFYLAYKNGFTRADGFLYKPF